MTRAWSLFAVVFGIGWGVSWLSANLLLLGYFGSQVIAPILSTAALVTTVGIVGPIGAGMVADATGSFVPFFYLLAGILALAAFAVGYLRPPPTMGAFTASAAFARAHRSPRRPWPRGDA